MLKTVLLSVGLMVGLATTASAAMYAQDPANCANGNGGEGNIVIGNGEFALGESVFTRVSERVPAGNGFSAAVYDQMAEGESAGQIQLNLRITDTIVDVVFPDGVTITARRCS